MIKLVKVSRNFSPLFALFFKVKEIITLYYIIIVLYLFTLFVFFLNHSNSILLKVIHFEYGQFEYYFFYEPYEIFESEV